MNLGPLSVQPLPVPASWECAYCGSTLPSDSQKCLNCGAPHGEAANKSMQYHIVVNGMSASDFERAAREAQKRALVFRPFDSR